MFYRFIQTHPLKGMRGLAPWSAGNRARSTTEEYLKMHV